MKVPERFEPEARRKEEANRGNQRPPGDATTAWEQGVWDMVEQAVGTRAKKYDMSFQMSSFLRGLCLVSMTL